MTQQKKIMAEWSDEEEEDNIDIVLFPPENTDAVTDDEEVDENVERVDNRMPNDVSGTIEIQTNIPEIEEKVRIDNNECTDSDINAERNEKEERVLEILEEIEECKTKTMKWKEHVPAKNALLSAINDESGKIKEAKSRIVDKFAGKEPHEIFEQYVNAELKAMIVEETNRYAAQKNSKALFTTADLETFNAVLMLTGYHSLPRTRMFWEKEDDIGLSIVYESISRREFEELKRFIHFADNYSLSTNDKFAKVRQLHDITNKNLKQFGFFHSHYSIDEQMLSYTGKNSSKQIIRTKTIRFGYKNFVICSDDGYPYFIDPYCGAKYGVGKASKKLTARSVIDCILEIDNWDDKDVYFDNWFTSLSLTSILKKHGLRAMGTVRADRLGKDLKINKKYIKCKERGAMQVYYERSGISCVTWNDNGPVTILSNVHADLRYTQVKRWDSSQRNYIKINRSNCITEYNKHMDGVDSLDESVYRIDVRGKKWY